MKKIILVGAVLSFNVAAFDVNPILGLQVHADPVMDGSVTVSPTIGGEVIFDGLIVGLSAAQFKDDVKYGRLSADVKVTTKSLWGGKFVTDRTAIKLGITDMDADINTRVGSISGSQTHLLIGTGYYFDSGVNLSLHLNVPVTGDAFGKTDLFEYTNVQALVGYRF